jgi:hypothetical protein
MYTKSILTGAISFLAATAAALPNKLQTRQTTQDGLMGLAIDGTNFDINYLGTFRVSYANSSAYLGGIKYATYSEPLVVANFTSQSNGISFTSIHASPTGFQQMYIDPQNSKPVGFSIPHGSSPQGVTTTGFSFGDDGSLLNNGANLFYACQDEALDEMHAWQIYWMAAAHPEGLTCKGPISIKASNGCARN